ncbi:hypothetical protein GCK32_021866 [Trichostrongylus colubriformis]|uniref:Uncharacterized protein n=1 Tax=Trichostrongylus colubriformis TaxID=6319 RepID=A0AAN8J3J4_TRICO
MLLHVLDCIGIVKLQTATTSDDCSKQSQQKSGLVDNKWLQSYATTSAESFQYGQPIS